MYLYILLAAMLSACNLGRTNYRHLTCYLNDRIVLDIPQPNEILRRSGFITVQDPVLNLEITTNLPCIYTRGD